MKESNKIPAREITDPAVYFNRRTFMRAGILAASAVAMGTIYRRLNPVGKVKVNTPLIQGVSSPPAIADASGFRVPDGQTSLQDITHYNNFYEFSTDKEGVVPAAASFNTTGWHVSVEGLVRKPKVFDLDEVLKISPPRRTSPALLGTSMRHMNMVSSNAMIKRLGGKRWRALHRLAYVAGIAGVIHYYMQVKADFRKPLVFMAVLAILLAYRLVVYWRRPDWYPRQRLAKARLSKAWHCCGKFRS